MNEKTIDALKVLWDYLHMEMEYSKCDIIMGCGCSNLEIPIKCAELYKKGFAPKVVFSGGLGKMTEDVFKKSEAEIYREIALENGVLESDIIIENESTNTGDNFRFTLKKLEEMGIKAERILIVHKPTNLRRTYLVAKKIMNNKEIWITSPDKTFQEFIKELEKDELQWERISVIVGDVQRNVIYPYIGWQDEDTLTEEVIAAYRYLVSEGYTKYIFNKEKIDELIKNNNLQNVDKGIYFL